MTGSATDTYRSRYSYRPALAAERIARIELLPNGLWRIDWRSGLVSTAPARPLLLG